MDDISTEILSIDAVSAFWNVALPHPIDIGVAHGLNKVG